MVSGTADNTPPAEQSFIMATADVDAIGAHCDLPLCRELDFLPFKCQSCHGKFCLDHRTETAHSCPKAGEWAQARIAERQRLAGPTNNTLREAKQCYEPTCKTLVGTALSTDYFCESCRHLYCLSHRFGTTHGCELIQPAGVVPGKSINEKGLAALEKLKAWGAAKKANMAPVVARVQSPAATRHKAILEPKKTAKGDEKIDAAKRVYLHVEAQSDTVTAKIKNGSFFYSQDWSVGKVLDAAAKHLQVQNVNNHGGGEESKLVLSTIPGRI